MASRSTAGRIRCSSDAQNVPNCPAMRASSVYMCVTVGGGDVTLALAILLLTIAGILFFVAFHNLPTDVENISALVQWISASIREGKPASGASTAVTA